MIPQSFQPKNIWQFGDGHQMVSYDQPKTKDKLITVEHDGMCFLCDVQYLLMLINLSHSLSSNEHLSTGIIL